LAHSREMHPVCRRTAATIVAAIFAVTIIVDLIAIVLSAGLKFFLPMFTFNVVLALAASLVLWQAQKNVALARRSESREAVCSTAAVVESPSAPLRTAMAAPHGPRWLLCCLPKQHDSTTDVPPMGSAVEQAPREHDCCRDAPSAPLPPHHCLPPAQTTAIVSELLRPEALSCRDVAAAAAASLPALAFPLLRIRTTGKDCNEEDLTPTLAFCDATLRRGEPFLVLFDLRDTGTLRPPPFSLVRKVFSWANSVAVQWDTHVQGIGILMTSSVMRPLLEMATKIMKPPQPMVYAASDSEALAFLAQQRTIRSHAKTA